MWKNCKFCNGRTKSLFVVQSVRQLVYLVYVEQNANVERNHILDTQTANLSAVFGGKAEDTVNVRSKRSECWSIPRFGYKNQRAVCCATKRRIDFRILIGNTLLCIEIENINTKVISKLMSLREIMTWWWTLLENIFLFATIRILIDLQMEAWLIQNSKYECQSLSKW